MIAIAAATLQETIRRRFVLAALAGTLVIAGLTAWGFHSLHTLHRGGEPLSSFDVKRSAAVLVTLSAFLFSFVVAFAAAMLGGTMLTAEVESGVLLPVLARPISRAAIVFGKALGLTVVLCVYVWLSGLTEFSIAALTTGYEPPHPFAAVAGLCGVALVVLASALALSSRFSTIASGLSALLAFGTSWIVGIVASFGPPYGNETLVRTGIVAQLLFPSDAFWRAAVYQLEPAALLAALGNAPPPPFWTAAPPPPAMLMWASAWILAVLAAAAASFSRRDV